MIKKEKEFVEITKDDGTTVDAEVIFTFEETGDTFILYAINDEVFPAKIMDDNSLVQIADDEWSIVEKIFNEYLEECENDDESE